MANVYLQDSTLTAIGDAIRSKTGKSDKILPKDMPAEIEGISGGGGGGGSKFTVTCADSSTGTGEHEGGELVELTYNGNVFTTWNIDKGTNVILAADTANTKFVMPQEDVELSVTPLEPKLWYYDNGYPTYGDEVDGDLAGKNAKKWATTTSSSSGDGPHAYDSFSVVYSIPDVTGTWSTSSSSVFSKTDSGELSDGRAYIVYSIQTGRSKADCWVEFTPRDGSDPVRQNFCILSV